VSPSTFDPISAGGSSIRLGEVAGITVRVHILWFAIPILFMATASPLPGLLFTLALFFVVFLHELGHSLVAQHFGIRVLDITFWPLGGMARMSEIPEDSWIEGCIAVAGPAVNFALALLGGLALVGGAVLGLPMPDVLAGALLTWIWINLVLGGFNLVPAFPMDGGRILRAWFGRRMDWVEATERAVRVGRYFAIGIFMLVFFRGFCMAPLIAVFIWVTGARELMSVRLRHGLGVFGRAPGGFRTPAYETGGLASDDFAAEPPRPTRRAAPEPRPAEPEPEAEDGRGARRPGTWTLPTLSGERLSDAEIAALERFRGSLRQG